jgi:hypothetical protein
MKDKNECPNRGSKLKRIGYGIGRLNQQYAIDKNH